VIVIRCDKCEVEVEQCAKEFGGPGGFTWPEEWVRVWNSFGTQKTDLCGDCKKQWDEIREPTLRRWLAAPGRQT
jgi:hypothetical protein